MQTLSYICSYCGLSFDRPKNIARRQIKDSSKPFCSKKCQNSNQITSVKVLCKNCNTKFIKQSHRIKPNSNNFCCRSCSASYNNKNKKFGTRRSKLEKYIQEQLTILYPNLEIHFNRKDKIKSELDIYIPSLNLAFELNGIFHYKPIFGNDKLSKIQNNDSRKFQACLENGIELCIIDVSQQSYFKPRSSQVYLDIIKKIVLLKGIEPLT